MKTAYKYIEFIMQKDTGKTQAMKILTKNNTLAAEIHIAGLIEIRGHLYIYIGDGICHAGHCPCKTKKYY